MNDHTQGGGVQIAKQIQIYVLLPSGCKGLDKAGVVKQDQEEQTLVQTCKQVQYLIIKTRQLTTAIG